MKNWLIIIFLFFYSTTFAQSYNNGQHVYNVKLFGAKGDGTTDDQPAIQNAINVCATAGGGIVYFPIGTYLISSTTGLGSQITFPTIAYSTTAKVRVKLLGEVGPNMFSDPLAGGAPPNTGVILKSSVLGAGAIIGGGNAAVSYLHPEIENITFRVRSKTAGVDVAPQMGGLFFQDNAYLTLDNVCVDTESNRNSTVQPAASVIGIVFPTTSNYVFVNADRVLVTGFGLGMSVWECASVTNYFIDGCYYGVQFNPTNHAAFFSKGFISRTAVDIITQGVCSFFMDDLGLESDQTGWFKSVYNLQENVAGAVGWIKYHRVISFVGPDNSQFLRSSYGPSTVKVESVGFSGVSTNFNTQTSDYDLVSFDREKTVEINSATDVFLRVPEDAECHIPAGTQIPIIQSGAGKINVLGFGVTINAPNGYNVSGGQYSRMLLVKRDVNSWYLTGGASAYSFNDGTTNTEVTNWSTASGVTDPATLAALNQFVTTLKNASIWSSFSAIYPFLGGTSSSMSYNLVNSSNFQITWHGTGTFNAIGFKSNGTTGYGDTGLIPNTTLSQNSVHMCFYSPDDIGKTASTYMGAFTGSIPSGLLLKPLYTDGNNYSAVNTPASTPMTAITQSTGIFLLAREASGTAKFVQNRIINSSSQTSTSQTTNSIYIGALNNGGTAGQFSTNTCAYASIGSGLNDTQKATYFNALLVLLTALKK